MDYFCKYCTIIKQVSDFNRVNETQLMFGYLDEENKEYIPLEFSLKGKDLS
jgi:hypothetical protein